MVRIGDGKGVGGGVCSLHARKILVPLLKPDTLSTGMKFLYMNQTS